MGRTEDFDNPLRVTFEVEILRYVVRAATIMLDLRSQ